MYSTWTTAGSGVAVGTGVGSGTVLGSAGSTATGSGFPQPVAHRILTCGEAAEKCGLGAEQGRAHLSLSVRHRDSLSAKDLHPKVPQGVQNRFPLGDRPAQARKRSFEIRVGLNSAQNSLPYLRELSWKYSFSDKYHQKQRQTYCQLRHPALLTRTQRHAALFSPVGQRRPMPARPLLPPLFPLLIGRFHSGIFPSVRISQHVYADVPFAMRRRFPLLTTGGKTAIIVSVV